jgi:hypothetical protein
VDRQCYLAHQKYLITSVIENAKLFPTRKADQGLCYC